MKPSLFRRLLFYAFGLWPLAVGALLANVVLFSFGEGKLPRLLYLAFILCGVCIEGFWLYYIDHSGLGRRVHDVLGLTRNPFTGRFGATQREIEEDAKRVRDGRNK